MGKGIREIDIQQIEAMVEKEFPDDPALQQIHIARKLIAKEAELEGLSFLQYIKLLRKKADINSKQSNTGEE